MKFDRIIGDIDSKLVDAAAAALSKVFLDLALKQNNKFIGKSIGGDPLVFSLLYPAQHVATKNIPTAGTDGKRYYWNPKFVCSKSKLGLRIVCMHEAWHAIYTHPQRRGMRDPKLWNIAVDYIVNATIMDDLKHRKVDPVSTFTKELGNFCTLDQYKEYLKNPLAKIKDSDHWVADPDDEEEKVALPKPDEDRALTEKEKKELAKQEAKVRYFFADPNLPEDMRRPEKIYDLLFSLVPKCPKCGRLGVYVPPKDEPESDQDSIDENEKSASEEEQNDASEPQQDSEEQDKNDAHDHCDDDECCGGNSSSVHDHQSHDHDGKSQEGLGLPSSTGGNAAGSGNQSSNSKSKPCDVCGGGYNIFGNGDTLDDHMDSEESPEKMAKRLAEAINAAKNMAGTVPGSLEEELGELLSPKIKWQDFLRAKISKIRDGNTKNDWTRFRTRPLFAGVFIPKRINQICTFGCLLDTSGSMSKNDMALGITQLQSIDSRSEGWVVPADATIYWDRVTKLRKISPAEIKQIKIVGRGGTKYAEFFRDYQQKIGKVDFLIVVTDGGLLDSDIAEMIDPGVDVIWLITSGSLFKAPFGRVFDLMA